MKMFSVKTHVFLLIALLVSCSQASAQFTPSANLKASYDASLKKINEAITKTAESVIGNKDTFDAEVAKYDDAKKRWDVVKGGASEKDTKNVTSFFAAIAVYSFSIPGQNDQVAKTLASIKDEKKTLEKNESECDTNSEYIKYAVQASAALQASSSRMRKQSVDIGSLILDMRKNVAGSIKIIQALEKNESPSDEASASPDEVIPGFQAQTDLNLEAMEAIAIAFDGQDTELQEAASDVMMAWYWKTFEDPESLSMEDQIIIGQCVSDIWEVEQYVSSCISTCEMSGMMWWGIISWAESQTDPWEKLWIYMYLAESSDDEMFDCIAPMIAFGFERRDLAMSIIGE